MTTTSCGQKCNFLMEVLDQNPRISQQSLHNIEKSQCSSDLPIT